MLNISMWFSVDRIRHTLTRYMYIRYQRRIAAAARVITANSPRSVPRYHGTGVVVSGINRARYVYVAPGPTPVATPVRECYKYYLLYTDPTSRAR